MGGNLTEPELQLTIDRCANFFPVDRIENFIETGTYKGDTTRMVSKLFKRVYTMEINSERYNESLESFKGIENIHAYLGDSVEILPQIMSEVEGKGACIWFLDAHQSGADTSNNGREHVPLLSELKSIFKNTTSSGIIIIDDVRLFSKYWDWADISFPSIDECILSMGIKIIRKFVSSDRYVLVIEND